MKIRILQSVMASVLLFFAGCSNTGQNSDDNVRRTATSVRIATEVATFTVLDDKPQARKYFEAGVIILDELILREHYDPVEIVEALVKIPVDPGSGIDQRKMLLFISSGLQLYEEFFNQNQEAGLPLGRARPVLEALRDGVKLGLLLTEPPSAVRAIRES